MRIVVAISAVLLPGIAHAHPGLHSGEGFGIGHLLADPFHLALSAVAVVSFLAIRSVLVRRSHRSTSR